MGDHSRGVWLLALLLIIATSLTATHVAGSDSLSDVDNLVEESVTAGLDQSILDSAAAEIHQQLQTEQELNQWQGEYTEPLEANSPEAQTLDLTNSNSDHGLIQTAESAFAFLSQLEDADDLSQNHQMDVESHLETIAAEVDSVLKSDADLSTEVESESEAESEESESSANQHRARARSRIAAKKHHQAVSASKSKQSEKKQQRPQSSTTNKPSLRQQKLIQRLDGYRAQRGHTEDVSTLEATAEAKASSANGYSMPSAYAPAVVGVPPVGPIAAYSPSIVANPAFFGVPTATPVVATPATNLAGVGALLQALKHVQQQQETASFLTKLSALVSAPTPSQPIIAAAATPVYSPTVASPFNYPIAGAGGFVVPQNLPGTIPGLSPSYPSFVPGQQASVGATDGQTNPFEAHLP